MICSVTGYLSIMGLHWKTVPSWTGSYIYKEAPIHHAQFHMSIRRPINELHNITLRPTRFQTMNSKQIQMTPCMDQISIDTNPKCRLYWCLIECIDWRYNQSCWYFRPPSCKLPSAPLTFSLVHLTPLPCVNKYRGMYSYSV